jgi:SAM-dependent methyltransferase
MESNALLLEDSGMTSVRIKFYYDSIDRWVENKKATILIVGGGPVDFTVFNDLGFENVTISNLDTRLIGDEFHPYSWSFQNAQSLSYENESFDFVVVHAALHHCESPHQALIEMYRVAKIGIIAFESRDSLLMRLLEKVGLTGSYEHIAVYYNQGKFGGVNNTEIPNYIYRWTEREIEKTISTYAPYAKHKILYQYGNADPVSYGLEQKNFFKRILIYVAKPFYKLFVVLFPKQQNLFAFYVNKPIIPEQLQDWIRLENANIHFDNEWAKSVYK